VASLPLTWLEPQPARSDLPQVMPSPFDDVAPHPLAAAAAQALMARLTASPMPSLADGPGKMFGVLLVEAADGRLGVLQAFSGQLDGAWSVEGFVGPLFDQTARATLEREGDELVKSLTARAEAVERSAAFVETDQAVHASQAAHDAERAELRRAHASSKAARREARTSADEATRRALDDQSRRDDRARRDLESAFRERQAALVAAHARLVRHRDALLRLRRLVSQQLMQRLADLSVLRNALGQTSTVRERFAPAEPSWGAGDCAAPKLLQAAVDHGLRPVALAEFWWGNPPAGGGRVQGMFFPACKEKCGPLLPFLLEGQRVAPRVTWKPRFIDDELTVVHEDPRFLVLLKPDGLLSVPARDATITDSVLARLRRRYPNASGPLLVHRLDLDTSGLLLAALDAEAFVALQAQFAARTVHKRYAAIVEGVVIGDQGEISLPLRVDLEQRPRQLVDEVHGKPAVTTWQVRARSATETLLALTPHTGRTHQLRVHCSHRRGLGLAIKGDRLYGRPASRLFLHAESLGFEHPETGARVTVQSPAPFTLDAAISP
jgi:tRNA pseudouridine32 synthase/23S rRNA pseudouridine746 synthase